MAKSGFWTDINTEPKRKYRWIMNIGGVPQWFIKKTTKPSYEVTESPHEYINHTFYYPGRIKWNTVSVTLVDPVTPDASKTLENIIRASGYNFPTDPNDVQTISKKKAVEALGNVVISQIGPEGPETIEEWELVNCFVKNVNYGDLDYTSDDMVEIELELRFDFAQMIKSGDGGIESADK